MANIFEFVISTVCDCFWCTKFQNDSLN